MRRKRFTKNDDDEDDVIYPPPPPTPPKPPKQLADFKVNIYVRSKLDAESSITPQRCRVVTLSAFTSQICTKLPLELRNQIYDELMDTETMYKIERSSRESLRDFPTCSTIQDKEDTPVIIRPHLVYPQFANEVVARFFEGYKYFGVQSPRDIGPFFNTEFFGMGLKATETPLSALRVTGYLDQDDWDFINIATLAKDFEPLLAQNVRKWEDFKLTVVLVSKAYLLLDETDRNVLATRLHEVLQQLKRFIEISRMEKGSLKILLETRYGYDKSLVKNRDQNLEWWKVRVRHVARRISFEEDGSTVIPKP
ncbi:hypothetical protein BDV96DRAFT_653200 [Lophiotrema nucula]|uniref:Uncharacterized protein n=1 Tax=Lophiotrema nucula TaxID=690887 RepID=A0A6A5YLY7_9PLEO|nr:hypothetical protein BDV96DRAFT_653200 [Lophiotrema nucula]